VCWNPRLEEERWGRGVVDIRLCLGVHICISGCLGRLYATSGIRGLKSQAWMIEDDRVEKRLVGINLIHGVCNCESTEPCLMVGIVLRRDSPLGGLVCVLGARDIVCDSV
jgi:hypothetical protein